MVRYKHRYLLCQLQLGASSTTTTASTTLPTNSHTLIDQSINSYMLFNTVKSSVSQNFGDYGVGCIGSSFQCKYYNHLSNLAIFKCSRDSAQMVRQACTMVTQIVAAPGKDHSKSSGKSQRPCSLLVLHVGATMKSCQRAAIQHNRQLLLSLVQAHKQDATLAQVMSNLPTSVLSIAQTSDKQPTLSADGRPVNDDTMLVVGGDADQATQPDKAAKLQQKLSAVIQQTEADIAALEH